MNSQMSSAQLAPPLPEIKVVVVGDGAVGKTCLCNVFVSREFPETYEPTIFENHTQNMTINGKVGRYFVWLSFHLDLGPILYSNLSLWLV